MTSDIDDLVARWRDAAASIRNDGTPAQVGLSAEECDEAATAIEAIAAERDEARPIFSGVAKTKLDDLTSVGRGWKICGYAIEKDGSYGLVTTGAFVGWWSVAADNAAAAEASLSTANAEVERLKAALKQVVGDYDACSGAEPSLSVLHRSIDLVARAALEPTP